MNSLNFDENLSSISEFIEKVFNSYPHANVLPEHVFLAILRQGSIKMRRLLELLDLRSSYLEGELIKFLSDGASLAFSDYDKTEWHDTTEFIFNDADFIRTHLSASAIGVEHIFCSLSRVTKTMSFELLNNQAIQADLVAQAINLIEDPEEKLEMKTDLSVATSQNVIEGELSEFGSDMTNLAEEGKLDPVIGRDEEIRQVLNILSRRTKNNPVLIGEAGVGKTAIAEGLALKLVSGDVPMSLQGHKLINIDVGSLVAGTSKRGQFEEKLKNLVETVSSSGRNIILFIDEIHLLVGAGGVGDGALDASNMLKPYLARGKFRCIGATTLSEYSKHLEKDPALARRFQKVHIKEPTVLQTITILRGLRDKYEGFHGVRIKDSALVAAVELSGRFITDRQWPDKAVDIVDEAAARKRMQIDSTPLDIDSLSQQILHLELERASLKKDTRSEETADIEDARLVKINRDIEALQEKVLKIKEKWREERDAIKFLSLDKTRIEKLQNEINKAKRDSDFRKAAELEQLLKSKQEKFEERQKKSSVASDFVDPEDIAQVVADRTGIPVTSLTEDQSKRLISLEKQLQERVIGQDAALEAVAKSIRIARTGLGDENKPTGTFMFLGPSGVGKTEVAKTIAEILFNGEKSLIRLDMSEYFDKYTVSRLVGASPGYVGYEEGGQLTEAVRNNPYSCVLFDEIEKAHSDIYNILLQVLDEGRLTDARGRVTDFRNTIIVLTSNCGADLIAERSNSDQGLKSTGSEQTGKNPRQTLNYAPGGIDSLDEVLREELLRTFRPELLNRLDDIVIFESLSAKSLEAIVTMQLKALQHRMKASKRELEIDPEIIAFIAAKASATNFGARPIKRLVRSLVHAPLSEVLLKVEKEENKTKLKITLDGDSDLIITPC